MATEIVTTDSLEPTIGRRGRPLKDITDDKSVKADSRYAERDSHITEEEAAVFNRPRKKLREKTGPLHCKEMPGYRLSWVSINNPQDPFALENAIDQRMVKVRPEEQQLDAFVRSGDPTHNGSDIRRTGRDGITLLLMKQRIEHYEEDVNEQVERNMQNVMNTQSPKDAPNAVGMFGKNVQINNYNIKGN